MPLVTYKTLFAKHTKMKLRQWIFAGVVSLLLVVPVFVQAQTENGSVAPITPPIGCAVVSANTFNECCEVRDGNGPQCERYRVSIQKPPPTTSSVMVNQGGSTATPAKNPTAASGQTGSSGIGAKTAQCPLGSITDKAYPESQCNDGVDNDGDGKADFYGVDCITTQYKNGDGILDVEPDPACQNIKDTTEEADLPSLGNKLIPCTNKCTVTDIFRLINKLISFFFTTILIPIIIIMIMYAGFQYITAQGNSGKIANLKKLTLNIVKGLGLMLGAWLIVKVIFQLVEYKDSLLFFK